MDIPDGICDLLEKTFNDSIGNFEVNIHESGKKVFGFWGEMLFLSLEHKRTGEHHHLAVKKVLVGEKISTRKLMTASFLNESYMYKKLIPILQDFQKSSVVNIFDNIAKCYGTISETAKEKLLLENLEFQNYEVHTRSSPVSFRMYQKIFELYGKFHALSFAFKKVHPEEYTELISPVINYWVELLDAKLLSTSIKRSTERVRKVLEKHGGVELIKKFQKYVDEGDVVFRGLIDYKDPYSVLLHGDAWSNNMMFKFSARGEIEDIKLLDFQMIFLGSPVFDLSYSLYSGAENETLNNLDELLELYHESLAMNLKQYNLDAEEIYTFGVLRTEWRKYCPYGFIAGLRGWGARTMKESEVPDVIGIMDGRVQTEKKYREESGVYNTAVHNLVKHMYDRNFL